MNYFLTDEENPTEDYATPMSTKEFTDGTLLKELGDAYVADTDKVNKGMPVFLWQTSLYKAKMAAIKSLDKILDLDDYGFKKKEIAAYLDVKAEAIRNAASKEEIAAILEEVKAYLAENFQSDKELLEEYDKIFEEVDKIVGEMEETNDSLQEVLDTLTKKIAFLGAAASLDKPGYTYTGKAIVPKVIVKSAESKPLVKGTDYTVSYSANVAAGYGKTTVTGKGGYSGVKHLSFTISPKKAKVTQAKSNKKRTAKVKWAQHKEASGYQMQYGQKKSFKGAKTLQIKSNKTTTKTIKKLKAKKTYYVKVRAYKTAGGKKLYGAWSSAKKVRIK